MKQWRGWGCVALFVVISLLMVSGVTTAWDIRTLEFVGAERTPAMIDLMLGVTLLNEGAIPVIVALGFCLLLYRCAGTASARTMCAAAISGELLYLLMKLLFHRPRPDLIPKLASAGWVSYPSGHTMMAPIIWSLGLILLARALPTARWPLLITAVLIPPLMALSRVVLGVHYPTDVLAGLALGTGWMFLWLDRREAA